MKIRLAKVHKDTVCVHCKLNTYAYSMALGRDDERVDWDGLTICAHCFRYYSYPMTQYGDMPESYRAYILQAYNELQRSPHYNDSITLIVDEVSVC